MEVNEITVTENKAVVDTTNYNEKAKEYLQSMGVKLPAKNLSQFLELAAAYKLNPFKREIYAVGYGDNWNIITGFEVYLKRAERTGLLDGWETEETGNVNDGTLKSTITIYRKDRSKPFKHTVYYNEAVNKNRDGKPNSVWAKMPMYMTKKVAMAQGFRLCFPDELAGMPYTADEINEPEVKDITPTAEPVKTPKTKIGIDAYKMNDTQAAIIKEKFSTEIFTEEEKNYYRNLFINKEKTAAQVVEMVVTEYTNRTSGINAAVEMVAEAFDGTYAPEN